MIVFRKPGDETIDYIKRLVAFQMTQYKLKKVFFTLIQKKLKNKDKYRNNEKCIW